MYTGVSIAVVVVIPRAGKGERIQDAEIEGVRKVSGKHVDGDIYQMDSVAA